MANDSVSRLAQKKSGSVDFVLPPFPDFPDDPTVWRIRQWWPEMQIWRETAEANIKTALLAIRSENA